MRDLIATGYVTLVLIAAVVHLKKIEEEAEDQAMSAEATATVPILEARYMTPPGVFVEIVIRIATTEIAKAVGAVPAAVTTMKINITTNPNIHISTNINIRLHPLI